jgi:GMP synthase PP-ATPase subunit
MPSEQRCDRMTGVSRRFSSDVLAIDPRKTAEAIETAIRTQITGFRRRGVVVGLSGGVDSSVVTCLCVRAIGAARVHVLLMPERDSSDESERLSLLLTLTPAQVERIYRDIDQKRRTTRYLHARPALVEPVVEIHS